MINIQKRLQTLFEKERIIFWYDDNEALKAEFEEVEIDGVEKRVINNNEFGLKKEVLKISPEKKFLIYSSANAPQPEENWLLDLNIANHMFSADKISIILQTLGLDVTFKPFMAKFEKFLNAKSRVDGLAQKITQKETNKTLALKMIAVSIGSEDNIENIVLKLFENQKLFETLEKYDLASELFKAIQLKYKYDGDSLIDFVHKLFQNHFYFTIDRTKCLLNSDARLFINSWMDSARYQETFSSISETVSEELNIKVLLESIEINKIMVCDTYEKCDQIIITHILRLIEKSGASENILEMIQTRKNTFWYKNYENIYNAILCAVKLIEFVSKTEFKMDSFDDGVSKYVGIWYKIDQLYREYCIYAYRAEKLEILKDLSTKIENIYLNGYLRELNDNWQEFVQSYNVKQIKHHQRDFYKTYVNPFVQKNQKIFVIISDALRYECGMDLGNKIVLENKKKDRFSVTTNYMISSLPSYTQLGMASLLPHKTLAIKDKDIVFVDDKNSAGLAHRDKILKYYNDKAVTINYEEFLAYERTDGREFVKNHQMIYIYHDEIDKMGEKNEPKTFDAVHSTFETIIKIIKQIANFNGVNILVTSDHGFLFTNQPTLESEFCNVNSDGTIKANRRFFIGKNLEENNCVARYEGSRLGIDGDNEFLIPKSINKIKLQGGGNRFVHGGATFQELVIPLIELNIGKGKVEISDVNVEIIPIRTISTNTVNVALYQSDTISETVKPITLKINFESMDGKIISDQVIHKFDSDDNYDTNREKRFKLTFKKDINEYNNKMIKLVARRMLENSAELPLYKEFETKLVLAFFNDFDDDF